MLAAFFIGSVMATKPETRLQRKIRKALEDEFPGSYWIKIHGNEFTGAGIPDLIGCVWGRFFGMEIKRPSTREDFTVLQAKNIEWIIEAEGSACIITSPQEAIDFVRSSLT